MRISDWSSDVCSSDLAEFARDQPRQQRRQRLRQRGRCAIRRQRVAEQRHRRVRQERHHGGIGHVAPRQVARIVQHRQLVTVEAVLAVGQPVQQQARQRECEQQLQLGARQRRCTRWFHGSASPGPCPQLTLAWACPHAGTSPTHGRLQPFPHRILIFTFSGTPSPFFSSLLSSFFRSFTCPFVPRSSFLPFLFSFPPPSSSSFFL